MVLGVCMGASRGGRHLLVLGAGCHTRAVPSAGCSWGLAAEQPHCSIIHRPACIPSTPPTLSSLYPIHNSSQNWPHKPCSLATIPWSCGACFMALLGSVMLSGLVKKEKKGLACVWQTLSSTSFDVFLFRRRQMWRGRCLFTQGESAVF